MLSFMSSQDAPESPEPPVQASVWEELCAVMARVPRKGLFLGLLAGWLAFFHWMGNGTFGYLDTASLPVWMWRAYEAPESPDSHGLLIPVAILGLLWWKRESILAQPNQLGSWWFFPLLALLVVLHGVGYLIQQPRVSILAFLSGFYLFIGMVWGFAWMRATFFPMFLLAFCMPLGSLANSITVPLRLLVTWLSVGIARMGLGIPVIREGSMIYDLDHTFQYDVAPACSGIRSLVSILALTTIYGFMSFRPAWKRLLIVASALPLAVLGNVLRITGVILAGEAFGQEAGLWVETKLGFLTFAFSLGCVMLLGWLLETRFREDEPSNPPANGS